MIALARRQAAFIGVDSLLAAALGEHGIDGVDDAALGLVFDLRQACTTWEEVEESLATFVAAAQTAFSQGSPIASIVTEAALMGRADALDAARAGSALAAMRTIALEGAKRRQIAVAVAVSDGEPPESVARVVASALDGGCGTGLAVHVGAEHLGRSQP